MTGWGVGGEEKGAMEMHLTKKNPALSAPVLILPVLMVFAHNTAPVHY